MEGLLHWAFKKTPHTLQLTDRIACGEGDVYDMIETNGVMKIYGERFDLY